MKNPVEGKFPRGHVLGSGEAGIFLGSPFLIEMVCFNWLLGPVVNFTTGNGKPFLQGICGDLVG